jgi:hypothetical protein
MREMDLSQVASAVVVLLPFEMEYLMAENGVRAAAFRRWPIEIEPGVIADVGMFDLGRVCPFLDADLRCGAYDKRPIDCWTYPLLPSLNGSGYLHWEYGLQCPSVSTFNPVFVREVKKVWHHLWRALPRQWWDLYRAADDWTGWPPVEEKDTGE